MANNRGRKRKVRRDSLSPKLKAFFEFGVMADGADEKTDTEDGDIFIMACSEKKIISTYEPYRTEILESWKGHGLPWAERMRSADQGGFAPPRPTEKKPSR